MLFSFTDITMKHTMTEKYKITKLIKILFLHIEKQH